MIIKFIPIIVLLCSFVIDLSAVNTHSIYGNRPDDPEAFYFTPENFDFNSDGKSDVSEALQAAINKVKEEKNFGVLFVPEGKYHISRTIYVPGAVRIIGYGKNRPEFILSKNSPGFDREYPSDKGKSKYMFWFTGGVVKDENNIPDANAGTFYSAMSNVNITIEDGNPYAVALRTHYAQHCFVSHMVINIGKARAGLFEVGNEMEDIAFYGGDYGIMTTKASPGWQVMMVDAYFEGQRKAAVRSQESGLAIVNLQVKNVPMVFDIDENYWEKIYVENGRFENVSGPAFNIAVENNSNNSITLRDVWCSDVPVLAAFKRTGEQTIVSYRKYHVKSFDHGLQMESLTDMPKYKTLLSAEPVAKLPAVMKSALPALPPMSEWKNLRELGAKGDGVTDDTEAIQKAIDTYDVIYVPSGWYQVTKSIKMRPSTRLIGLHPFATQFRLGESTPAFSGFGTPVAILESAKGSEVNVLNGIGINTGAYNYRAVGVKWTAGAKSYVNDVKFVGGHGSMWKPVPGQQAPKWNWGSRAVSTPDKPVRNQGMDQAWDTQYWSLWVTDNGGGIFKDIWTANTYATNGFYAENTSTEGRIYAMSIEHHVRNEVRFRNVSNWKVYCMQTEEETVESSECQPIDMDGCSNVTFANLYMFRVIRVVRPYHSAVRLRGCRDIEFLNVYNYAQTKYTTNIAVYDQNKGIEVRPWEFSRLIVKGDEPQSYPISSDSVRQIAGDFDFIEGLAHDSKGNIYFCDNRLPRLWTWSEEKGFRLLADFHWKPYNVAVDTEDNILVTFRYDRQPGWDADPIEVPQLPDSRGTSFSGWGNSGHAVLVYTIDSENPEETLKLLEEKPMLSLKNVAKALYPSNRWRDFHDFNTDALYVPKTCFVAPDGKTIIPRVYDLARCSSLLEAVPGRPCYLVNEYDRRTVVTDVASDGTLSNMRYFTEDGEFGLAVDKNGNIYIGNGEVQVYDRDGNHIRAIHVPERPSTLTISGDVLYITGRKSVYSVKL